MPSLKEIQDQIKFSDGTSKLLARGEIKELPNILWGDETVENMVQGYYSNGNGILVATNRRLVFVYKKFLGGVKVEDFPYDKISSIQYETGMVLGKITIFTSGNKADITQIEKKQTRDFCESVRARISATAAPGKAPSATASIRDDDVLVKLERLMKLKEQGGLDEQEFQDQKRRILGPGAQQLESIAEPTVQEKREEQQAVKESDITTGATRTTQALEHDPITSSPKAKPDAPKGFRSLCWFFGVCFFLVGFSQVLSDDISFGIIMFAIAGLLIPSVRDWTYGITGRSIPTWVRTISIFSLIIYGAHISTVPTDTPTSASKQKVGEETIPQPATAPIPAEEYGEKAGMEQARTETSETEPEFDITIEEFVERYNQASNTLEVDSRFSVKEESDNDKFLTVQLEAGSYQNLAMILTANNKTRVVRSLVFLGSGDGTIESGVSVLFGIVSTVMAIENPLMPVEQRGEILRKFDISGLSNGGKIELTRGNVKYTLSISEVIGTTLVAEPKNS